MKGDQTAIPAFAVLDEISTTFQKQANTKQILNIGNKLAQKKGPHFCGPGVLILTKRKKT